MGKLYYVPTLTQAFFLNALIFFIIFLRYASVPPFPVRAPEIKAAKQP